MIRLTLLFFCLATSIFSLIEEKVLICGTCRDVESKLPHTMAIMEKIGRLFSDYRILVYENNSSDQTAEILSKWSKNNPRVSFQSEHLSWAKQKRIFVNLLEKKKFYRPELIARARNLVLDQVFSPKYEGFNYVIWMDMDFTFPPAFEGIVEIFTSAREWDAVLAYGIDPVETYWDWYAFRDTTYPIGSELLGNDWWYMPKKFVLTEKDDWHPVYSAFGGCGIYKKESIRGCRYSAIVTQDLEDISTRIIQQGKASCHPQIMKYLKMNDQTENVITISQVHGNLPKMSDPKMGFILFEGPQPLIWRMSSFVYQYPSVCEHVCFHASMIKKGHDKIFINPRFIFRYGG